jgi:hypothetical protein
MNKCATMEHLYFPPKGMPGGGGELADFLLFVLCGPQIKTNQIKLLTRLVNTVSFEILYV